MSARSSVNSTDWLVWVESEALLSGWLSVRPYKTPGNRTGAPDLMLARHGDVVIVWVRPDDNELTIAQRAWSVALLGSHDHPSVEKPIAHESADAITCVLTHPNSDDRDLLRDVLR